MKQQVRLGVGFGHCIVLAVAMLIGVAASGQTINVPIPPAITCNGGTTTITATVTGGTGPYTYSLDNIDFSNATGVFVNKLAGSYTVYAKDGVTAINPPVSITLTQPGAITFSTTYTQPFTCAETPNCNGAYSYNLTGGTNPTVTLTGNTTGLQAPTASKISFTSPSNTTNYQLKVETSSAVRSFTDVSGNSLDFWYEGEMPSGTHVFWVLIPTVNLGENVLFMKNVAGTSKTMQQIMVQGGLNVTAYGNSIDFTGVSSTCVDVVPINQNWPSGISMCSVSGDNDNVSIRWEGWFLPVAANAYYGINTNDGSHIYFNEASTVNGSAADNSDQFFKTGATVTPLGTPIRIRYDYANNDGVGRAYFGYSAADPANAAALTTIPVANYYYRNMVAITNYTVLDRYDQLCGDTYTVTVSDANGCQVNGGVAIPNFVVFNDTQNPNFDIFPDDYYVDIATYLSGNQADYVAINEDFANISDWTNNTPSRISVSSADLLYTGNATVIEGTIERALNASHLENIELQITAKQAGNGWNNTDYLEVLVDYGTGSFTSVFQDKCVFNATQDAVGEGASQNGNTTFTTKVYFALDKASSDRKNNLRFQIKFHVEGNNRNYIVSSFMVRGDQVAHFINPTTSGTPTCTDDYNCTPTYTDSDPVWLCDLQEGYITRAWTIVDDCGKTSAVRNQKIIFGTRPAFTLATLPTLTFDFCNNNNQTINIPAVTDACSTTKAFTPTLDWQIQDLTSSTDLGSGTGAIANFNFNVGHSHRITWTATDVAGATQTKTQDVIIKPAISLVFGYNNIGNVCKNENVVFVLTPSGGTGVFNVTSFSIGGGTWNAGEYTYTKSWPNAASGVTLTGRVTDLNATGPDVTGGCYYDFTSDAFDVHENIGTGVINRQP